VLLLGVGLALSGRADGQQAPRFESFDSDDVRLQYVVLGSGPAVVLVHGFAISAGMNWLAPGIADTLAKRFTVIVPDLRGHGASDKPHDPAAYGATFVDDLVRLLDHLRIQRAHVVGYSMGAAITLKLLTSHPDRVISAVLGGGGWQPPDAAPPAFLPEWLQGLDRAATGEITVAEVIRRPEWPALTPGIVALLNQNDPRALAAVLRGLAGLAVAEPALRASAVPVLAVVGETDRDARAGVERLAGVMPTVEVSIVPGADHVSAIGHPLLLQAIAQFLDSH
jgi:pimeloyl-ACP methyl ester carboxylesterase